MSLQDGDDRSQIVWWVLGPALGYGAWWGWVVMLRDMGVL